jgi:hypothetical protein
VAKHIHGAGAENGTKKATQEIGTEQRISNKYRETFNREYASRTK